MSTAIMTAAAIISGSTLMISKRSIDCKLYLENSPFPISGYTPAEFYAYFSSIDMNIHLPLLLIQLGFLVSGTVLAFRFISTRSTNPIMNFLALPSVFAGLAHAIECLFVLAYLGTNDRMYVGYVSDLSVYRARLGLFNYSILGLTSIVSLGLGAKFIGRDSRQVIKKKQ